jgi:hypothetical protein
MSHYGSDYDDSDYMHATDYYNSQCENFSQDFYTSAYQSTNMLEIQNILEELATHCRSFHLPKQSVHRTRVKVSREVSKSSAKSPASAPLVKAPISSKIPKSPASAPLVKAPISVPLVIASISVPPASPEISVTLKIDCSAILSPPTDDEILNVTPGNLDLVTSLEPSPIIIKSLSAVDAESKAERAMPELVVPESVCVKQESLLDQMHAPRSVERFPLFSIIPTVQMFKDLFHTCTLHKFELGRDPPVVLNFADSKSGFGLVHKFQDLFHTCTLDQFELGRDPPNVLDIGDSRFGFG